LRSAWVTAPRGPTPQCIGGARARPIRAWRVEVGRDEQRERGDDGGELHRVPVRRDRSLQAALGDLTARGGQRVGARSRTPIAGR
jgi:hypothetical protein